MAKQKVSYNPIPNADTDFTSLDPENGLPWSGKSIQEFIRKNIALAISNNEEKTGDMWFDPTTYVQYFFRSTTDKVAWEELGRPVPSSLILRSCPFSFEGTQHQIRIINKMDNDKLYFTTNAKDAILTVGFISQRKAVTDSQWEEVHEDAIFSVSVDKGNTSEFEDVITNKLVLNGDLFSVDVLDYLRTGDNRVIISCVGVNTNQITSFTFKINLTSMYLSPANFRWHIPFIEGEEYALGGMNIGGAVPKIMHIKLSNEAGYSKSYEENIGTDTYITNAYYFKGLDFPKGGTGIYNVEVWLDAEGLESDHLVYNIMCISAEDKYTAQLIAVSEIKSFAVNYAENTLFYYSVYNGGASEADPHINITAVVNTNPIVLMDETLAGVPTLTAIPFNYNLEIETQETDLDLDVLLTYGISQKMLYEIDNSASYPPMGNTKFYLNAANRNNNQSNKYAIVNEANKSTVLADWQYTAFIDGIDGWTLDDKGRRCLLITAGGKVVIKEKLFKSVQNITFEIAYKAKNVADYSEPIITCCDDVSIDNFKGIKITPDKILLHSRDLNNASNDLLQGYDTKDEEIVHALITITRNYKTDYGNLAQIYVNGGKKIEFEFNTNDSWEHEGNLIIGADNTDTYIYYVRVYDKAFGFQDAQQNHLSSLSDSKLKAETNTKNLEILDDSYRVDYYKCLGKYNCLTIEMLNGGTIPSKLKGPDYTAYCNIESFFAEHPEWNWVINNVWIEPQGTTAKNYWLYNLRFRLDKSNNLQIIYADGTVSTINRVKFAGDLHPLVEQITSKKNYASSEQGNKMFGVEAYDDLYKALEFINELGERVALYQMPFLYFEKILKEGTNDQYIYKFIGLFTVGPDKADPGTFGYDKPEAEDLISLEGVNHSIKGAGFNYPYDKLIYRNEAIAVNKGDGSYEDAFEVSFCKKTDVQSYLDDEFQPFYNAVYENSCMIIGTNVPIADINRDVASWTEQKDANGHSYSRYEIWIDGEYDIYYLDRGTNKFTKNKINLLTQLNLTEDDIAGLSITEKNNLFIQRRLAIYDSIIGDYLDRDVEAFHNAFCFIFGVKDNFIKNNYPFKVKKFIDGGKWRKRQDDLDSITAFDNQGLSSAGYSIELFDWTDENKTAYVFKGENNVLLQNEMKTETGRLKFKQQGKRILDAMYENAPHKDTYLEGLMSWVAERMFNKAQDYFSISLYNIDAEYSYEEAWPPYKDGRYKVDINPLSQSRGSAYETIKAWLEKRFIYCMSYFGAGPFEKHADDSLGTITFRTQDPQSFTLTPAIDLYPAAGTDNNMINSPIKVKEGESITISNLGGTNTNAYIMAADYLSDIGDLSSLAVDAAGNPNLAITSKRLKKLKVGDINPEKVTTNIKGLTLGSCPSLETIDARNLESLTGDIDLTNCPRLKEAYFGNTDVRGINLKNGSKIKKLQTSSKLAKLTLQNLGFLELENFENNSTDTLEYIRIENCKVNPFGLLKQIYDTPDNQLKYIRVVGFDHTGTADDISLIRHLATDIDNQGNHKDYSGIDSDGLTGSLPLPVLEGHIRIPGSIYEDDYNALKEYYPNLALEFNGGFYIRFADPVVQQIAVANWASDGVGVTTADTERVASIGTTFKDNTEITSFDEFEKFSNVTVLGRDNVRNEAPFKGCANLSTIKLPQGLTIIWHYSFDGCTSLKDLIIPETVHTIADYAFRNVPLQNDIYLPNLKDLRQSVFDGALFTKIHSLGNITYIPNYFLTYHGNKDKITKCIIPQTVTKIGPQAFYGCTSLSDIGTDLSHIVTMPESQVFRNTPLLKIHANLINLTSSKGWQFSESGILSATFSKLQTLEDSFFKNAKNLTKVKLGADIKVIESEVFLGCDKLEEVEDLDKVVEIGGRAFNSCPIKNKIIHFDNLTSIRYGAFEHTNIEEIYLPKARGTVGLGASVSQGVFAYCPNLRKVEVGPGVTSFGNYAFRNDTALEEIDLSNCNLLTSCGYYSFLNCTNLKRVILPEVPVQISDCFQGCTSLEYINLENVTSIGNLKNTKISGVINLNKIKSIAGNAFEGTSLTEVYINSTDIKYIGGSNNVSYNQFTNIKTLTKIRFSKSMEVVGGCNGCTSLSDINLVDNRSIRNFNYWGFSNTAIDYDDLRIPNAYKTNNDLSGVFSGTNIKKVSDMGLWGGNWSATFNSCPYLQYICFPRTVTSIDNMSSTYLKIAISLSITPPTLTNTSYPNALIYVPDESLENYKETAGWKSHINNMTLLSDYVTFEDITSHLVDNVVYETPPNAWDVFEETPITETGSKSLIYDVRDYNFAKIVGYGGTTNRLYCFLDDNNEVVTTSEADVIAYPAVYIVIPKIATKMVVNLLSTSPAFSVKIGNHIEE